MGNSVATSSLELFPQVDNYIRSNAFSIPPFRDIRMAQILILLKCLVLLGKIKATMGLDKLMKQSKWSCQRWRFCVYVYNDELLHWIENNPLQQHALNVVTLNRSRFPRNIAVQCKPLKQWCADSAAATLWYLNWFLHPAQQAHSTSSSCLSRRVRKKKSKVVKSANHSRWKKDIRE